MIYLDTNCFVTRARLTRRLNRARLITQSKIFPATHIYWVLTI
jgi:hypothetical protein